MTGLVLSQLKNVSVIELGRDYSFRKYAPGDWENWEFLASASLEKEKGAISFDVLQRKQPLYKQDHVFFLSKAEKPVATASIQRDPSYVSEYGFRIIHIYGDGGKDEREHIQLICEKVLEKMKETGADKAWASGEPVKAKKTLRRLGFKEKELKSALYHHDHTDYDKRTKPLYRWHTERIIGESTGDAGDARGDESLYKPASLGRAWSSIGSVSAGEEKPFELFYEAGSAEIGEGTTVKFWMAGQGSLGTAPQMWEPDFPGFVEVFPPRDTVVEPLCAKPRVFSMETGESPPGGLKAGDLIVGPVFVGFTVVKGCLSPGQRVRISVGGDSGFTWKKLAQKKEFKVIVEPGRGEPRMRLPEPVRIDIRPGKAEQLEVFLPGSAGKGEDVSAVIVTRDRYENRVPINGPVTVEIKGLEKPPITAYLSNGRGEVVLGTMDKNALQGVCSILPGVSGVNGCLKGEQLPPGISNICVPSAETQGRRVFFGDMHTHDFQSTAEGYPADCYLWAREDKRLDFQSLPIQVHRWMDNEKWTIAKHMAEYFLHEGRFVTFLGFEWQHSAYGDKVIHYLGGDMPYLPVDDPRYADPARLYEALRSTDAFIISHHPGYELDLHVPGTRWETLETDVDRILEIWSMHGSSEGFDRDDRPLIKPYRPGGVYQGLREGVRMGFAGGSDTHTARPGGSLDDVRPYKGGLCAVWAEELTRRSLFEAFLARRTYAVTDARIVLHFTVNGAPMGSEISFSRDRDIRVRAWAPSAIKEIQILKNTELWKSLSINDVYGEVSESHDVPAPDERSGQYYHCRVVLEDGNLAVSSPVWVG